LFQVSEDVVFQKDTYQVLRSWVEDTLKKNGVLTAAEFRDAFSTSRKYALALLEHLDSIGLTVRDGDVRKLRSV
jgi:selenocysteine-specific elongation factor